MTDIIKLGEAEILALNLASIKAIARDLGYHVVAVEDGYLVRREDEIGHEFEGTDLDTSYVCPTEDDAYRSIRRELATMADMSAFLDARRNRRMN